LATNDIGRLSGTFSTVSMDWPKGADMIIRSHMMGQKLFCSDDAAPVPAFARRTDHGTPPEYKAGLDLAIAKGRQWLHESGTFVKLTESGAALFELNGARHVDCAYALSAFEGEAELLYSI
jgi:hypothetical protein